MTVDSDLPFRSILQPGGDGKGRPYVLLPSRHRSAWLLPAGPMTGTGGLKTFGHRGVTDAVARALVAGKLLRGDRLWLNVAALERDLAAAVGMSDVRLAFSIGTSGAYRKLTAQVLTHGGQVLAYAKLATDVLARESLRREHETLSRLAWVDGLRQNVPAVLGWFAWRDAEVLLVSPGYGQVRPGRLTDRHAAFLHRLHDEFARDQRFETSGMWMRMVQSVSRLAPRMPGEWTRRWQRGLERLEDALGPAVLPLSLAHRDFTPWNTRLGPAGLFVFDWETAADGMTPLYDVFHFHAVQAARARRPFRPGRDIHGDVIAGAGCRWPRDLPHFYLAYLLDMSLLYAEARLLAPRSAQGPEYEWLGRHLDTWERDYRAAA